MANTQALKEIRPEHPHKGYIVHPLDQLRNFSITEGSAWMSTLNNSVQYVSVIRPGEKVAKLVKRMHYVSFVGMFRSDLFEGLCVGCLLYTSRCV